MSNHPTSVLITGATSSIGSALARYYARPDCHLILHGRNAEKLQKIVDACRVLGAKVTPHHLDLRDQAGLREWLKEVEANGLPELIIANAGMNCHIASDGSAGEPWHEVEALLEVNLKAIMIMMDQIIPGLRQRRSGQVVLMGSLAGWYGLPVTPTYCATKAAVKAYAEALRGWLAPEGIKINLVMPGYVESDMCFAMPGPKPFLWTAERAALKIASGVARDKARITFPFPLNFGTYMLSVMHPALSQWFVRVFGYHG